jgi:hypothetical protein
VNPETGRAEHSEYRWVDYASALRMVSPRVIPVLEWASAQLGLDDEPERTTGVAGNS